MENLKRTPLLLASYNLAEKAHTGYFRKFNKEPYFYHPLRVADACSVYGLSEAYICAALLHDTIEDTDVTYDDIVNTVNKEVADIVLSLTNDRAIRTEEGRDPYMIKKLSNLSALALNVKLIDRLDNVKDFETADEPFIKRYGTATINIINGIKYGKNINRLSQLLITEILYIIKKYL